MDSYLMIAACVGVLLLLKYMALKTRVSKQIERFLDPQLCVDQL